MQKQVICIGRHDARSQYLLFDCNGLFECILWLSDSGKIQTAKHSLPLVNGDILLLHHRPCPLQISPQDGLLLIGNPEFPFFSFSQSLSRPCFFHVEPAALQKYNALIAEWRKCFLNSTPPDGILSSAFFSQLYAYLYADCHAPITSHNTRSHASLSINRIVGYVEANLNAPLTLNSISQYFSYDKHYVCRQFKKGTGKTLTSYIHEQRIARACMLLQNGVSPVKAAEAVGYNNYSHFYKTFKRIIGCAPAHFNRVRSV